MKLGYGELRDKIAGCWQGKNAGGALGAPLECKRGKVDVEWYMQPDIDRNPPPNDDLDLQIAWLCAAEEYGSGVSASILADYWLTYITPNWSEYGIGKSNLRRGIAPPLSGRVGNYFKDSCGCFIRSEIWACLCPGLPELATRYAYLDGCVDHADEGVYGELFFAAVESAAFIEHDFDALIDIGLSYIPADCAVAKAVNLVRNAYRDGTDVEETRKLLFREVPGAFSACWLKVKDMEGDDMATAPIGFDAPNNIGITMLGWLYGEGDFGKSICIAAGCCEDADCSAGTIGAILGIIKGEKGLPKKWLDPIDGIINTVCIEKSSGLAIPKTVDELTDRVMACIPRFLPKTNLDMTDENERYAVLCADEFFADNDERLPHSDRDPGRRQFTAEELTATSGYTQFFTFDTFKAVVTLEREPFIGEGEEITVRVRVIDSGVLKMQQWVNGNVYVSSGLTVVRGAHFSVQMHNARAAHAETEIVVRAENMTSPEADVLIDLSLGSRHDYGVAKIKLFAK